MKRREFLKAGAAGVAAVRVDAGGDAGRGDGGCAAIGGGGGGSSPGDIRSYGVSSVNDLLAELAPQLTSSQGRGGESPIVLLAGKRISSFAEIRDVL